MDFKNPLSISQGDTRDNLRLKVVNPDMFVSKNTGMPMTIETELAATIPKQFPKGLDADQVMNQAASAKNSFTAVIIIQVILSFFLKGIIDDLWGLFLLL